MALTLLIISAGEVSLHPFNRAPSKGNDRPWTGDRTPSQVQGINIWPPAWCAYVLIFNLFFIYCTFLRCSNLKIQSMCTCSNIINVHASYGLRDASRMPLAMDPNGLCFCFWIHTFRLYVQCSKEIGLMLLHTLFQNNWNKCATTKLSGVEILQNC